jgi:cbb3-type cytochrome oxidase maturation FixS-like protein
MNVLIYLVPMALGFGLAGLFAFLWALKRASTMMSTALPCACCRMTIWRNNFFTCRHRL